MINVDNTNKNKELWLVSQAIEEMMYPTQVLFQRKESSNSDKLSIIVYHTKTICVPTHLLFKTEKEALVYASVNFLKLYYNFDPFFVSGDVDEDTVKYAYNITEKYEEEDPSLFLYHWMGNVPDKF